MTDLHLPPEQAFGNLLEGACQEFEVLLALIRRDLDIVAPSSLQNAAYARATSIRAGGTIKMALAKSFLFNANRANRICQKNKAHLNLDRKGRDEFLRATKPLTDVRHVNEHGYDGDVRSEKHRPSIHKQGGLALDELSLAVFGPDEIIMGPLNLSEIYPAVARMRDIMRLRNHGVLPRSSGSPVPIHKP